MKTIRVITLFGLAIVFAVGTVWVAGLCWAEDPPKGSTTTLKSTDFHQPAAKSVKSVDTIKVPTPQTTDAPKSAHNPTGNKEVEGGWQKHQQEHGK